MSHRYNFTPVQPQGVYIVLPVDDAPPLKEGKCIVGYLQCTLTQYKIEGDHVVKDHWIVEKYWTEPLGLPEFSNVVIQ